MHSEHLQSSLSPQEASSQAQRPHAVLTGGTSMYMGVFEEAATWPTLRCRRPMAIVDDGDELRHDAS